eukprot:CAMPEP_0181306382 /NCGR_PEP_ID=MMETSP1101-20121128/10267_1 /TAXON_ID=46948 /ORGANISM="Rhodomonas abbreviata, Strain Caron Lab Isolate" /LENGTH=326 /DNA_ID=CAMNT_0023412429 /DNA_START=83 /DNA_END=1063 /DNA_ORIENTATION=+
MADSRRLLFLVSLVAAFVAIEGFSASPIGLPLKGFGGALDRHVGLRTPPSFSLRSRSVPFRSVQTLGRIHMSSVQESWDNHFSAFGAQDVDKILKDYTEESQIVVYDAVADKETVFTGLSGAKDCFDGLFATLSDLSELAAPNIIVEENPKGMVFLQWACPSSGITAATDTFIFDENNKIAKQNVVVWPKSGGEGSTPLQTSPTGGAVQEGWDNHFSAFGAQDVEKILKDYTEESKIVVSNWDSGSAEYKTYTGLAEIKECFEGLFDTLSDISELGAPAIRVEEAPHPMVFLVWQCPSSGIVKATDTFLFDKEGKIVKQNVVVQPA